MTLRSVGDDAKGKLGLKRAEATIIDGGGKVGDGPGVAMAEGSTLDGFTVTNVGVYDEAEWNKHHATHGNDQPHEHIGEPGTAGISAIGLTCSIKHNIVHHIGYTGIAIQGADGKRCAPQVLHSVCYRNMGGGIGSMRGSTAIIEANVCFQNFYAGIGHEGSSPFVVNNVCYENIRAGIGISEGSKPVVRGNRCYKNRRAGIGIRTGAETRPIVEDNDCFENDMAGIGCEEECEPILRNNRCHENTLAGIGCRDNSRPTIVGNECSQNKAVGIGFDETDAGQAIVLNNRVFDNEKVGIGIHSGWKVRLAGNELSTSKGLSPVVMVFKNAEADFTDNTLRGTGVAGIRAEGTIRVTNNTFETPTLREAGPPQFAVWGLPGADIVFTGNKVSGWRHALLADKARVTACDNRVAKYGAVGIKLTQPVGSAVLIGNVRQSCGITEARRKVVRTPTSEQKTDRTSASGLRNERLPQLTLLRRKRPNENDNDAAAAT
ncbi:MAG: F-box protein 11 [Planctomycetota bacterium]|nr:MAG: F-box protein 11 [Planctomycetota bacterium]